MNDCICSCIFFILQLKYGILIIYIKSAYFYFIESFIRNAFFITSTQHYLWEMTVWLYLSSSLSSPLTPMPSVSPYTYQLQSCQPLIFKNINKDSVPHQSATHLHPSDCVLQIYIYQILYQKYKHTYTRICKQNSAVCMWEGPILSSMLFKLLARKKKKR